ncbi:RDD family protein [Halobacillus karajensis]|uniref:RDD family protein n=1 Tax=Halobacillus karajensis TaxID=195088 RepID=A0A024P152_9BACI|nr:RDD family protein [Halobacillus karajensis]CDQ19407.1 RDD family protein [Halobacillus karajensis]CDQ21870.1 RDD family protein [Halobacillus karajensis]CDQ27710.1 RDD family protein [Halobacillus karajensis]
MDTTNQHPNDDRLSSIVHNQKDDLQKLLYAGFGSRFAAYIIDLLVIWSLNTIVTRPLLRLLNLEEAQLWVPMFSGHNITTSIIFFVYFILMTKIFRATLGKMIFGLSVVSFKDDTLTNGQIIFRECIGRYISMAVLGIPYLVVAFTKRHQGIHDLFADTSVIKNKFSKLNHTIERRPETV